MKKIWQLFSGPEDIGQSAYFWFAFVALIAFLLYYPRIISEFESSSIAFYLLNIPIALGLCLLWGYAGVLSFGQVAYLGIAGYVYGIVAGNMIGNSWGPLVGSIGRTACLCRGGGSFRLLRLLRPRPDWMLPF